MKTTLELPSELMKAIKLRAVDEHRTMTDLITELLQQGMAEKSVEPGVIRNRVKLPLVEVAHAAQPGEEMTPERVSDILLAQEVDAFNDSMR
jgi:plasmid stability protein